MPANDFLVFGGGAGANVMSQADWAALTQRLSGFQSGVAQSAQLNKAWRQSSIMAAVLAQFISSNSGQDALDDGTTATLVTNLGLALQAYSAGHMGHGQCRLSVVSGTSLKLAPYNGNNLIINGVPQQIPAAGVTIGNGGLAAATLYYAYAYMNAGAIALELSATGHVTGTNGIEQKSGDATRTLVGMIRTNASSQFADSGQQRFCLNWFNRRTLAANNTFAANRSTTSTTLVEISSTERAEFLCWADEYNIFTAACALSINATGTVTTQSVLDGLTVISALAISPPNGNATACPSSGPTAASEGYHYATLFGNAVSGFTTTWPTNSNQISVQLRG